MSQPRSRQVRSLNLLASAMVVLLCFAVSACAEPPSTATIPPSPTTTLPPEASTPSPEAIEEPASDETPETSRAKRRYPVVLEGHTDAVRSAEFSPDGTAIVTASDDQTAITWDGATGAPIAFLRGHSMALSAAHFDGSTQERSR